jgi:long-subunit acyl-CoA synthetase (AMP-forming)
MSAVLLALYEHAHRLPEAVALRGDSQTVSYAALVSAVERQAERLRRRGVRTLGLLMENAPAWAAVDLAAQLAGVALVPLPGFFSDEQLAHAIDDAAVELVITDAPARMLQLGVSGLALCDGLDVLGTLCTEVSISPRRSPLPTGIAKVTYTSGTTGNPKGACLSQSAIDAVAQALYARLGPDLVQRHLCLLPLATLLENIGGLYVPLLAGGEVLLWPAARTGLQGAAGLDAARLVEALRASGATSAILIPQMLQAVVALGTRLPDARFLAVGGAPVAPDLLRRAAALSLPVFEGYGLSESASVVCVNTPAEHRAGSVGRRLPHADVRVAPDGELFVRGGLFSGYLHDDTPALVDGYWATGDLGHVDSDGYVYVTGRKKNIFITAYGRNVAPEWVERELILQPAIAQAVVYGEARPWNAAIIVARGEASMVEQAIVRANGVLPDYARVTRFVLADEPFSVANGQLTGTGRPRRAAILARYGARLSALYESTSVQEVVA